MAGRRRKSTIELEDTTPVVLEEETKDENPVDVERPNGISLASTRNEYLRQKTQRAHTIADLEAWRAEIDATIAFLRSNEVM